MIATINTDASFFKDIKRSSFAFWISTDIGKFKLSGMLKESIDRPEIGEFMCIINALYFLGEKGHKFNMLIINTDCLNVIHVCNRDNLSMSKYRLSFLNRFYKRYSKIIQKYFPQTKIEFRHLHSHKNTLTARNWVNEWCDIEAKKVLKQFKLTMPCH